MASTTCKSFFAGNFDWNFFWAVTKFSACSQRNLTGEGEPFWKKQANFSICWFFSWSVLIISQVFGKGDRLNLSRAAVRSVSQTNNWCSAPFSGPLVASTMMINWLYSKLDSAVVSLYNYLLISYYSHFLYISIKKPNCQHEIK